MHLYPLEKSANFTISTSQASVFMFEMCQQFCEVLQKGGAFSDLGLPRALKTILQLLDCSLDSPINIFLRQALDNIDNILSRGEK